jgi:hypothetical protein
MNFYHAILFLSLLLLSFVAGGKHNCDELHRRIAGDITYHPSKGDVQSLIDRGDAECLALLFSLRKYAPERYWPLVDVVIEKGDWVTLEVLVAHGLAGSRERQWFEERHPPLDIKEPDVDDEIIR